MGNAFSNYTVEKINDDLIQMLEDSKINMFKIFTMKDQAKLSVTLSPLDDYKTQYHGLHPCFDESYLRQFLSSEGINKSDKFWELINKLYLESEDPFQFNNGI